MRIFILFILLLFLLAGSQTEQPGIPLRINNAPIDRQIFLPKDTYDQLEANQIISRLEHLPVNLQQMIVLKQIQIKLFTGKLTDEPSAAYLAGTSPRGYQNETTWDDVPGIGGGKLVLVKIGHSNKGEGHGSVNLELHELAHSIDRHVFNKYSATLEFQESWLEEKEALFPGQTYFLTYPEEYFAECFAMFYLNEETRQELLTHAPKTYTLIKELNE